MAKKRSSKVSECVQTSKQQDDENGPLHVPVTSLSSDSSQETHDSQTKQITVEETLPLQPKTADIVNSPQKLSNASSERIYSVLLHHKPHPVLDEDGTKDMEHKYFLKDIKCEPCDEEYEQDCDNYVSKSVGDPLEVSRPTRAAKKKCLHQLSKIISEESSCDAPDNIIITESNNQENIEDVTWIPIKDQMQEDVTDTTNKMKTMEGKDRNVEKQRQYTDETPEERQRRLEVNRRYTLRLRANETVEQRERRREKQRLYDIKRRNNLNVEQREKLKQKQREYLKKYYANKRAEKELQRQKLQQPVVSENVEQQLKFGQSFDCTEPDGKCDTVRKRADWQLFITYCH